MTLESVRIICRAGRLPATLERVLVLSWVYEQTPQEIADKLQITVGAVQTRLSRARAQIKKAEHVVETEERETVREHAEGIWDAMRRLQCSPTTPQYDEWGEVMPVHARAVTLDDVIGICRSRQERAGVRG